MLFRRVLSASIAAVGLLAAGAATPAQSGLARTYDLTLAGVFLGTISLRAEQEGDAYEAFGVVTPSALVGALTRYAFDGRAVGRIDADGRVTPVSFTADSTSPRATRRTEIEWRDGAPVRVSVEPPRRRQADLANVVGALDPVSAGFALLRDAAPEQICASEVEVFDGSRRSRLVLREPVEAAGGFTCEGLYARIEGEENTLAVDDETPFTVTFLPNGEGEVRLERIETRTRFGLAVISRRG